MTRTGATKGITLSNTRAVVTTKPALEWKKSVHTIDAAKDRELFHRHGARQRCGFLAA